MTANSLTDGIVLWELQEKKCQRHVCQHTDVAQTSQAGWMVLILEWKIVKFAGKSALVIALLVANTPKGFLKKTVDPTSATDFKHLLAPHVTVVQTEYEAKYSRNMRTQ